MDALASISATAAIIFLVLLVLLAILLPFSAYAAQKWAHKNYRETKELNAKLDQMLDLLNNKTEANNTIADGENE